jgi:UDP:flavonoid glycosyltransferase YjiC (YdhE family)
MKYLFCSFTNFGFLCPAISIARALQQRGHEVAFVTGPAAQGVLQQAGLKRIPRGPEDGPSFQIEQVGHPAEILRQIRHIEYALDTFAPHVLIGQQLTMSAIIAGKRHHLPVATLGLSTYPWPTDVVHGYYPPTYHEVIADHYKQMLDLYHSLCEMFSLPTSQTSYNETPLIGDLFLLQSVPELEGDVRCLPDRVCLIGACEWNPPQNDHELQVWLQEAIAADVPIFYLQVGTTFQLPNPWPYLAEVLGKQAVRVVASVGRMTCPPETIPANFFVRNHVSQGLVLPFADAVISSSTTTSVLGAFTQGLPLLLIPGDGGEQTDLTLRCLHAGAAIGISPTRITNEILAQKIDELLNSAELRRNTERMHRAFSQAKGPQEAADLLEEFAAVPSNG